MIFFIRSIQCFALIFDELLHRCGLYFSILWHVDSFELATPELFSDSGDNGLINQDNNEKEPKIFESSKSDGENLTKEPEMFEESNLEEDFEIPAFLRRQKN